MKTKTGIYLNLNESEYFVNLAELTFYFSSELYRNKFKKLVPEFIKNENIKMNIKYDININLDLYFAISLYKKIEKRGFRIYDNLNKKVITRNVKYTGNLLEY